MAAVPIMMPVAGMPDTTHGVLVSPEDEDAVKKYRFKVFVNQNQNGRIYVKGTVGKKKTMMNLSHFLIGKPPAGHVVDHINNSTTDNRRCNLRFATHRQNGQNRAIKPNESGYLGVRAKGKKWSARCNNHYIGTFATAVEAAHQYDSYVVKTYGEHAKRNFPDQDVVPSAYQKRQKTEALPTGVQRTRQTERFIANIRGMPSLGTYDTPEEASAAYQETLQEIEAIKREALEAIPIDYDMNGVAVVPARKAGSIVANVKVDVDMWHDLISGGINLSPDGYPQTRKNGVTILVHRYVFRAAPGTICDHINRDRLDARRANLRIVTASESLRNSNHSFRKIKLGAQEA